MSCHIGIDCTFVGIVADAASANGKLVRILQSLVLESGVGGVILFYYHRCSLHQVGRITSFLYQQFEMVAPAYSLTRILQMYSAKKQLKSAVLESIDDLEYHRNLPKPDTEIHRPEFTNKLIKLLCPRWGAPLEDEDPERQWLGKFLDFFANVNGVRWSHFCRGDLCCKNRAHAVRRGKVIVSNMLLWRSPGLFTTSRWLKQVPSISWLGKGTVSYICLPPSVLHMFSDSTCRLLVPS